MERKNCNNVEETHFNQPTLNPMVFHQSCSHITEHIFEKIDEQFLKEYRKVARSWQILIDNRNILWKKMAKRIGGTSLLN